MTVRASIVGGSGYVGGELLRVLLGHPEIEVVQITSQRLAGKFVHTAHPNLRSIAHLQFSKLEELADCDVLFLAMPHGEAARRIAHLAERAPRLIDLSADFRLRDPRAYETWYREPHPAPDWLSRFVYGLPELHRSDIAGSNYVSGVGCNATAVNLALWPLAQAGWIESVVADLKVGSSEGGAEFSLATHHPERSGSLRTYAPTGHRHQAEIRQELGPIPLQMTATAVEMVRGVLATLHVFLNQAVDEPAIWQRYRQAYANERFVRLVKDRSGIHRLPDPKLLAGTNFCDVGFQRDPDSNRVVVLSALDNLMKGAAGTAVQCLNLMCGFPEDQGLEFAGLHPI
jgi:N-acetyl-gamma-glutamyl-phosphate/LysW-gamma-L-alpha-aminoadipyl-6-phosphate reductase